MISLLCNGLSATNAVGAPEFFDNLINATTDYSDRVALIKMSAPLARRIMDIDGWQTQMTINNVIAFCKQHVANMPEETGSILKGEPDAVAEWMQDMAHAFVIIHITPMAHV